MQSQFRNPGQSPTTDRAPAVADAGEGFQQSFHRYFDVVPATTPELRDVALKLRYAVYCEELGFEPSDAFADGRERDQYDHRSLHCLLRHRPSGRFAGCTRLVLGERDAPFPFEDVCEGGLDPAFAPREDTRAQLGEISRLAVHANFRRRREDRAPCPEPQWPPPESAARERRAFPHLAIGLYLGAAALGLARGLDGVYALMEPRLQIRLRRVGIHFQQVGEPVEHRGTRVPFMIRRAEFLDTLPAEFRSLLDALCERLSGCP